MKPKGVKRGKSISTPLDGDSASIRIKRRVEAPSPWAILIIKINSPKALPATLMLLCSNRAKGVGLANVFERGALQGVGGEKNLLVEVMAKIVETADKI